MLDFISSCRVCESKEITDVIDLGDQSLTGVFPKKESEEVTLGKLILALCKNCNLLQLRSIFNPNEMYGDNYGYRSGLNKSMVDHLTRKINLLEKNYNLKEGETVIDIGSNDCTSLKAYKVKNLKRLGIDPTGRKFQKFYPKDIQLIDDFFSYEICEKNNVNKAKIITSIAMFYDLENPIKFVLDIGKALHDDGIWHFEQSYMPSMLRMNSYDTICHEHIEYYSLKNIQYILDSCNFKILDVAMNSINGGSFAVTACKKNCNIYTQNTSLINWLIHKEEKMALSDLNTFKFFNNRIIEHKNDLLNLLRNLNSDGKKIFGYGASTKGNVILQYLGINNDLIPYIAEVNEEKFGRFTPGTKIKIISEAEAKSMKPDYFLVLPWHFRDNIIERENDFLNNGGKLIFPLPEIEII